MKLLMHTDAPSPQIQGHHVYSKQAGQLPRFFSKVSDFAWLLVTVLFLLSHFPTQLRGVWVFGLALVLFTGLFFIYSKLSQNILGKTIGEFAWALQRVQSKTYQSSRGSTYQRLVAIFLTLLPVLLIANRLWQVENSSLFWMSAPIVTIESEFIPTEMIESLALEVRPFFYTTGLWPSTYESKPVFHTLPYEIGPPKQFVGHIIARWKMPHIYVVFEGPKTPFPVITRAEIERCFLSQSLFEKIGCYTLKRRVLDRHLLEMKETSDLKLSWIRKVQKTQKTQKTRKTQNNEIADGISVEMGGILLKQELNDRLENRLILFTLNGQNQTIVFRASQDSEGQRAEEIFFQSVRTLSITDNLGPGRAWVEQMLQDVNLHNLALEKDRNSFLNNVSRIQSLLLSKISVDPKTMDTFFHLGGTAYLLFNEIKGQGTIIAPEEDTMILTRSLLHSAYSFAKDIAKDTKYTFKGSDTKLDQLMRFWQESHQ